MKKKWKYIFIFGAILFLGLSLKTSTAEAASWGAKTLYTTPKSTRGTWYYKDYGKIKKLKITKHTAMGRNLYKRIMTNSYGKLQNKLYKLSEKKREKLLNKFTKKQWQAMPFIYKGHKGFSTQTWLAGAGASEYFVTMNKTRHGKKVKTLLFGSGVGVWDYAYKSRKLAK